MAKKRDNTSKSRKSNGQWIKGISGNPAGKPPGSISIVSMIKAQFRENPAYFDKWVQDLMSNKMNQKAVMEQIDGKPVQPIAGVDGQPLIINIMKYGKTDSN